jgi:chromosome transmission fidelity protein 1
VVLLDEAHNIIESISNMYSTHVTLPQLEESGRGLKAYIARYMTRFSSKNLLQLKQIAFIVKSLVTYLSRYTTYSVICKNYEIRVSSQGVLNLIIFFQQKRNQNLPEFST